jgi:hypothetical protein
MDCEQAGGCEAQSRWQRRVEVKEVDLRQVVVHETLHKEAVDVDMEGVQRKEAGPPYRYAIYDLMDRSTWLPARDDLWPEA